MEIYSYTGVLKAGDRVKGKIVAIDEEHARSILKRRGIFVVKLKKTPSIFVRFMPVSAGQHTLFFDSLAKLLESGVSLPIAVEHLADEQFNPRYALFLRLLKDHIDEGYSFAEALEKTGFMSREVIEIIRAGEESGKLPEVLRSLTSLYTERERVRKAIKTALVYPVIVMLMLVGIIFYAPRVFEKIKELYTRIPHAKFPKFSLIVISGAKYAAMAAPVVIAVLWLVAIVIIHYRRRNPSFRRRIDSIMLHMPVIGKLILYSNTYSAFVAFRVLYTAGVAMNKSVELVVSSQGNAVLAEAWQSVYDEVVKGVPFSIAIRQNRYVPDIVKLLISVGEESGRLDEELNGIVKYLGEQFNGYVKFVNDTVGPLFIAGVGAVVAVIMVAIYLPILKVPQLMRHIY